MRIANEDFDDAHGRCPHSTHFYRGQMMKTALATTAIALGLGLGVTSVQATLVAYTDYGDFTADLAASGFNARVLQDFDGIAAGTLISEGDTIDGLTFSNISLQGTESLMISNADPTFNRSPPNSLGTNDNGDDQQMENPDGFTLSFPNSSAFGLWFLTSTPAGGSGIQDDDFMLTVLGTTQGNNIANVEEIDTGFTDLSYGYFIGFIDTMKTFNSAAISSYAGGTGNFQFRIDDIEYVPAPSTLALLAFGAGLAGFRMRRGKR